MLEDYFNEFEATSKLVQSTLDEFEASEPPSKEQIAESHIEANMRELKRE